MVLSLPLLSCESSVSVKENPDRKKKKYTTLFLLCLKINDPQTFKSRNCKNPFFKRGCYGTTSFDERFLFHVITGRHYFS